MQDHVHPREVVGGAVQLLAEEFPDIRLARDAQEKRAGPASRIIGRFDALFVERYDLGKGFGNLLWGVKLTCLLARARCKLRDQVFVGVT